MIRLVLDTNVVVSVLLFEHGSLNWILESWRSGQILPLASELTNEELNRVLTYPRFNLGNIELQATLNAYLAWAEVVEVPEGLTVPTPRDPSDRSFLELAIAGNADALVTGDGDLLALAPEFSIPIITPRELRERMAAGM